MRAGEYEVAYEASQPLKKKYSIDSTMEELLNHPDIRAFLSQMMEVDMIPDIAYGLSLRDVAKTFAGEIKKDERRCWMRHWQNSNQEGCYGAYKA